MVEIARGLGLEAWPNGQGPPEYAITNPRFGDVVVVAPLGTAIAAQSRIDWLLGIVGLERFAMRGIHGHRPELPEMGALFGAIGRGVAAGARPGTVRAVDVAPTVLALLGLPIPEWMEGRPVRSRRWSPAMIARRASQSVAVAAVVFALAAGAAKKEENSDAKKDAKDAKTPISWYARSLVQSEAGIIVWDYWAKGRKLRAETIVGGTPIVTFVSGEFYTIVDMLTRTGVAIRRAPEAIAADKTRAGERGFGREGEELIAKGAEFVRSENLLGPAVQDVPAHRRARQDAKSGSPTTSASCPCASSSPGATRARSRPPTTSTGSPIWSSATRSSSPTRASNSSASSTPTT